MIKSSLRKSDSSHKEAPDGQSMFHPTLEGQRHKSHGDSANPWTEIVRGEPAERVTAYDNSGISDRWPVPSTKFSQTKAVTRYAGSRRPGFPPRVRGLTRGFIPASLRDSTATR
jgi:hypothetical protein